MAEITLGGKRRELKFNFKSMRAMEKHYNKPISKVFNEEMQSESLGNMVTMMWAFMIHDDKKLTTNKVEDLISDALDNGEITLASLSEAIKQTMDESLIAQEGGEDESETEPEPETESDGDVDVKN